MPVDPQSRLGLGCTFVLVTILILGAVGPVTARPTSNPEWDTDTEDIAEDSVSKSMYVDLHEDGDATVRISVSYRKLKDGKSTGPRADQEDYYYGDPGSEEAAELEASVTDTLRSLAATAETRTVNVTHVETTSSFDKAEGLVYWFTFDVTNVATTTDGSMTVTQPFAGNHGLFERFNTRVVFTSPANYTLAEATPEPSSSGSVYPNKERVGYGETSLEGFSVTFEKVEQQTTTAEPTTTELTTEATTSMATTQSGESVDSPGTPLWLLGFGILFVVVFVGVIRLRQDG